MQSRILIAAGIASLAPALRSVTLGLRACSVVFVFEIFLYFFFCIPFVEFLEHITDDQFTCKN